MEQGPHHRLPIVDHKTVLLLQDIKVDGVQGDSGHSRSGEMDHLLQVGKVAALLCTFRQPMEAHPPQVCMETRRRDLYRDHQGGQVR
jgi:hypothetical protein